MAAREFTIHLKNETPFTLKQVAWYLDHGEWTDDGRPSETIEPFDPAVGNWATWHSESDGVGTGTEGSIRWRIQDADGDSLLGEDLHRGRNSCLMIHWSNPYVWGSGTVPLQVGMEQCPGDDQILSPEPTQVSTDYQLFRSAGMDNTDDDFAHDLLGGVFIGPLIFAHGASSQIAWLTLRLGVARRSAKAIAASTGFHSETLKLPDMTVAHVRPLTGTSAGVWLGRWAPVDPGTAPGAFVEVAMAGSSSPGTTDLMARAEDPEAGVSVPWTTCAVEQTRAPYDGGGGGPQAVPVDPVVDPLVTSPVVPSQGGSPVVGSPVTVGGGFVDPTGGVKALVDKAVLTPVEDPGPVQVLLGPLVDTLVLTGSVSALVYGRYNAAKELIGPRLRLLETDGDGAVTRELLLDPVSVIK